MKERPIIFSAPMVRAILEGRKTQTRRIIKSPPEGLDDLKGEAKNIRVVDGGIQCDWFAGVYSIPLRCPYGISGDRLWVRETWAARLDQDHLKPSELRQGAVGYWADGPGRCCNTGCPGAAGKVRSPIHMPRWASRITLDVSNVRVERVQDISEEDAKAEGCRSADYATGRECILSPELGSYRLHFQSIWNEIHGNGNWDENPWVWVIEFTPIGVTPKSEDINHGQ